jgi:type I restriction enzyme S subunit
MGKATFEAYGIEEMTQSPPFKLYADWPVKRLGNICDAGGGGVQTGPFGSQLHKSDYVDEGIPSIMPVNIADNRIVRDGIACITEEDAERLSKYRVQKGDIVYSRRGDVKRRSLVREAEEGWLCGTGCLRVRFGEGVVDHTFASYYLAHSDVQEWVARHAVGATMPNLNTSILSSLPFVLPPLETQKAIAHILGTLDDKIELNRRMNETLEAMAQALFKSWFVDFDPVKAKMEGRHPEGMDAGTAALFPDKLVESELGLIPEGWEVGSLKKVAKLETTTVKPFNEPGRNWEHYSIPAFDAGKLPLNETGDEIKSNKYAVPSNCVLASKLNPQFPRVWLPKVQKTESAICSTEFMPFVPKVSSDRPFLYELFRSSRMQEEIINKATGSTGSRQRVKPKEIAVLPIVVPTRPVLDAFNILALPLHDKEASAIESSGHLGKVRDTLLPKLISGELEV